MPAAPQGIKKRAHTKPTPTSRTYAGRTTTKLQCTQCGSTFGRRCELKRHLTEVHNADAQRYHCGYPACNKSFTRKDALAKHHGVKHEGKRQFQCPTCGETFTSRYDLSRHALRVHSSKKKRFTCGHCTAGFSQKSQLTMHKARVHRHAMTSGSVSTSCSSSFVSASALARLSMPGSPAPIDSLAAVAVAMVRAHEREKEAATRAADTLLEAAEVLQTEEGLGKERRC